jgi:lambda family phage tail tape measure protein
MDEAALGLKVDATGVQAATKALEDFVDQGAKTEKAMAGVEGAAAKIGKSLKTLGDGASKGLDDIGKSAPAAAESVGRVAKSAEDAKRALAGINASVASLGQVTTAATQSARGMDGFATSLQASQRSLMEMQAQVRAASTVIAQMGAVLATVAPAAQSAARAQADAAKSATDMATAFKAASDQLNAYSASAQKASTSSKDGASGVKSLSDAGEGLGANMRLAVRGVQAFLALQIVGWAVDASKALYEASASAERLRISLDFSSVRGSAAEIAYLRKTTFDLGLSFESTAKAYQQFSAAARSTSLEGDKARAIFESVAKASAVMGLSADQTSGVLLALQQMISKGTVQSEELRGQLGERLPGAFQTAARAMGVTTAELGKMLEQGQVVADDFLPKFAQELDRSLGGAAEKAANRLDAAVNRFNDAWSRLKQTAGDSGVSQALAKELTAIGRDMTAISDSIENSSKRGAGAIEALGTGAAVAAGRAGFASLNLVANTLNGTINLLTGGVLDLRTDLALLPDALRTNSEQLAILQTKSKEAEQNLAYLQTLGGQFGNETWYKNEIERARAVAAEYRSALSDKQTLMGVSQTYVESKYPSRGSRANYDKELAEAEKGMLAISARANGVTKQFLTDLKAVETAFAKGVFGTGKEAEKRYAEEITKLNIDRYNSTKEGKEAAKLARAGKAGAGRIAKADLASDLADIQLQYRLLTTASGNAERLLDAQRAAGLVSEREYYAQKRKFVEDNAALQIRELEDENKRYAQQAATGADKINNEKKIAQNTAKMAEIRAKADTDIKISTLQQEEANRQLEASYKALEQSMAGYLRTSADRYQRELQGMGLGNQWRDQNAAANQINDRYESQRNDLRNNREQLEKKWNSDLEEQYQRRLEIINDANQKALGLDADYWRRRLQMQQDWTVGANEAITNYLDEIANVAKRTENIVGGALSGLTTGLTDALFDGNLDSLQSVGKTIAKQITAGIISEQISAPLAKWLKGQFGDSESLLSSLFGSLLGGKGGGGGGGLFSFLFHAKGGVYDSPSLSQYSNQVHSTPKVFAFAKGAGVFAEAGPEAIMPLTRNSAGVLGVRAVGDSSGGAGGGRGGDRVYNINVQTVAQPGMSRATALQQGADYGRGIQRALERNG